MDEELQITFDESASEFILDAFPDTPRKCAMCGKSVDVDNFGGVIHKIGFICTNITCLTELAARQEDADPRETEYSGRCGLCSSKNINHLEGNTYECYDCGRLFQCYGDED